MKTWLNSLNEREKWMVSGTTLCLIIYLFYLFLYAPLGNRVKQKTAQLTEQIQTLEWMKKVNQQNQSSKPKKTMDNSKLLTLLATQLKKNESLQFPFQLQQTASGEIQLSFDEVPFKLFITWLARIDEEYTLSFKQLDVTHTEKPGVTRLMIILSAGL